ncbi:MAG: ParB/RepB/Spo0J family partition protein [Myxococcota bacterium]
MAAQGEMFGQQSSTADVAHHTQPVDKTLQQIDVGCLQPGVGQPRELFAAQALADLAASVRQHGILQPLVVRQITADRYEIIAGERRWRAAKQAELTQVPCLVMQVTDQKTLTLALIENIQREDLNALEEATAYQRLLETSQYTQQQLAQAVGKDRSVIANALRLLKLPDSVKELIVNKKITGGHARALASLAPQQARALADQIAQQGMTVRQAEQLARASKAATRGVQQSFVHQQICQRLQQRFGAGVQLRHSKGERGSIVLQFKSAKELNHLLQLLTMPAQSS